ncbi:MAG: efflux RND transporter periplasmic adaptor subunit [Bacteroidaceae bacterium]|nr:efflux RND transporter periplasmic adaptor subunit [Bacteroidaceae bacterium]
MKKIIRPILILLVVLLFIGTFVFLWWQSRPTPVTFETVIPIRCDIQKTTVITGKIEPRDEVNVKPQMSGIIAELLKEAGDRVEKGEVIARLKVIPDMNQLSSAEARVRLANINANQARTDYERQQRLYDKGLISANEFEKSKQAFDQSREEVLAAQDQLEVIRDGVSSSNASSSNTLVRSTISGRILNIPVKVGNSVILSNTFNDGTTIASVADMSDLIFRGNIDETEVGRLSVGMPMQITIGALQNMRFEARLEYISPKATEASGVNQFEIKAAVKIPASEDGTTPEIRSGYSATANIVLAEAKQVLSIPEGAITFSGDTAFVQVIHEEDGNQTYERRAVVTGLSDGINIEIKSGLKAGEKLRGLEIMPEK